MSDSREAKAETVASSLVKITKQMDHEINLYNEGKITADDLSKIAKHHNSRYTNIMASLKTAQFNAQYNRDERVPVLEVNTE